MQTIDGTDDECGLVRADLEAFAYEELEEGRRSEVRAHLLGCAPCRLALRAVDPSALFLDLRGGALPAPLLRRMDADLRTRLAAEAARPAGPFRALRDWALVTGPARVALYASPVAMLLVLGVTMLVTRPGAFFNGPRAPQAGVLRSPYAPLAEPRPATIALRPAPPSAAPAPEGARVPALEEVASPKARVYRFDAGDETAPIYLVVDESIDI